MHKNFVGGFDCRVRLSPRLLA